MKLKLIHNIVYGIPSHNNIIIELLIIQSDTYIQKHIYTHTYTPTYMILLLHNKQYAHINKY